ncbi:MAG: tetratricopeptide repeat protein [Nitrospirales bacterium]|nr:tetratricopeptide repeat protein [Nitrospirales bacterium]
MIPSKPLIVSLLIVSLATACATPPPNKEAEFNYKMGLSYLSEGDSQKAFVYLQQALQQEPDNKDVLNNLGLIYLSRGDLETARDSLLRATAQDSSFSDAFNNLGVVYTRMEKWQDAINSFQRALSNPLYPSPEKAFYNLGSAYYRSGQYASAIQAFSDALTRSPRFPLPYYGLALAYNKTEMYGDAASAIAKALELDPTYQGNRDKLTDDIRARLETAKGTEEKDLQDYLEILRY